MENAAFAIVLDLERLLTAVHRASSRLSHDRGALPLTQRLALAVIVEHGPLTVTRLAALMGTTRATASRTTDRLVSHNLVQREPDRQDRRRVAINATPEGIEALHARRTWGRTLVQRALAPMEPDHTRQFANLLAEFATHMLTESGRGL